MSLKSNLCKPNEYINPLLEKRAIEPQAFEVFKNAFETYKTKIDSQHNDKQSEPNIVSNALKPFFEAIGYTAESHSQKGHSGIDLTLKKQDKVSVIIEAKVKDSKEMITLNELNRRALHEAVLYYMRERDSGNTQLYHVIITDFYKWFIFDAKEFERHFYQNPQIKRLFQAYKDPSLLLEKTKDFYEGLEKILEESKADLINDKMIECTYFDATKPMTQKERITLAKLLSPNVLYKEFNPNDANSLNKDFYTELLYILGLEEQKDKGKKIIARASTPQMGSFYENIANKLGQYGKPTDFETIIKLIIIWINRILFLKLLESQIVRWNDNKSLKFLTPQKINDFDKLEMLFFEILAKRPKDRLHREFDYIPYLNSSLFENHPDEDKLLKISNLSDDVTVPYYARTVVKDAQANRKKGNVGTLTYLFEFLDGYDFGSEGETEIASESKSLINASVLGLIFEKINGYKDGSFYTPSFITMYMARESIQKSVIEGLNNTFGIEASNFEELIRYCDKHNYKDEFIAQATSAIDNITICDPAVGSGHFLVSALNELLYTKYELGLIGNKKIHKLTIENDELLIKLHDEWFEYIKPNDFANDNHALQKLLFEEKQRIIENQLFGVDINPNSTQITKLRLWIELLKHSYYDNTYQLVTLPNIDINIKTGNSLISRFALTDELKLNNIKHEIQSYKEKVHAYKENKGTKKEVMASIEALKGEFGLTLKAESKAVKERNTKLKEYAGEGYDGLSKDLMLTALELNYRPKPRLFDAVEPDAKSRAKLLGELTKAQAKIDEIEQGKIYEDAFEWRFEFPEVLDENGDFVGFDIVIGNPPYFNIDTYGAGHPFLGYLPTKYPETYMDKSDILFYFLAKATEISKSQTAYIISNAMLFSDKAKKLRNYLVANNPISKIINFEKYQVFEEASITSMMIFMDKHQRDKTKAQNYKETNYEISALIDSINFNPYFEITLKLNDVFALVDEVVAKLNDKIDASHPKLGDLFHVGKGMETASNEVFSFDEYPHQFDAEYIKARMSGEIINKYTHDSPKEHLLYFENVATFESLPETIQNHLLSHKEKLSKRATVKNEGRAWWRYSRPMHKEYYQHPKIWCSYRAKENIFCLDESSDFIGLTNTTAIFGTNQELSLKYILALLNSKALNYRYRSIGKQTGSGVYEYFENQISKLPIPYISTENQLPFIELVDKILELKRHNPKADTSELEKQIDVMVYALYGLTEDEIKQIES